MYIINTFIFILALKWYYDQKISSFFPSDFESVFAYRLTGKILSFEFYPKAVYFECKFWILWSAITHVQTERENIRGLDLAIMTSFTH